MKFSKIPDQLKHLYSSVEEFNNYIACLSKLKVGNKVEIYLCKNNVGNLFSVSNIKTEFSKPVSVILVEPTSHPEAFGKYIMLRGDYKELGLSQSYSRWDYYAFPRDVRIKSIIK